MTLPDRVQYWLFAIGYTTKGVVYFLMGVFAIATVVGLAYETNGPHGVMEWLQNTYFGDGLLFLLGTGLGIYAFYKLYSAFFDSREEGTGANALGNRFGWALNGFVYATLSYTAYNLMWTGRMEDGDTRKDIIQIVLRYGWGETAVLLAAATVAIVGMFQGYIALAGKHMKFIETGRFHVAKEQLFINLGRLGIIATSIIYLIMAWFLWEAADMKNGEEFRGVGESLEVLEYGSTSSILLLIMGVGLLAYSMFMLVMARYGRA